jgi:hypothetical protein
MNTQKIFLHCWGRAMAIEFGGYTGDIQQGFDAAFALW